MPVYSFQCKCGNIFVKYSSIKDYKSKRKCSKCGKMACHSVILDHKDGNVDSQMKDYRFDGETGTRLYPCAVLPNQLEETKKKHPGTEYKLHNGSYLPVIKNRAHKLKFLKEHGWEEK